MYFFTLFHKLYFMFIQINQQQLGSSFVPQSADWRQLLVVVLLEVWHALMGGC